MAAVRGWEEKGKGGCCLMGTEFQFGMLGKFWRWAVVMDGTTI